MTNQLYKTEREAMAAVANKISAENQGRRWRVGYTANGWFTVIQDRAEHVQIGFNGACVEITAMPSQNRMLVYKCSHWELVPDMCQAGLLSRSQPDPACDGHVYIYVL